MRRSTPVLNFQSQTNSDTLTITRLDRLKNEKTKTNRVEGPCLITLIIDHGDLRFCRNHPAGYDNFKALIYFSGPGFARLSEEDSVVWNSDAERSGRILCNGIFLQSSRVRCVCIVITFQKQLSTVLSVCSRIWVYDHSWNSPAHPLLFS